MGYLCVLIMWFLLSCMIAIMNWIATNTLPRENFDVYMLEDEHVPFRFVRMMLLTMWIWD